MDDTLSEFLKWSRERGITFTGLEIRRAEKGAGNGVFTQKSFRSEEKIIELPEGLMITAGKVAEMEKYSLFLDINKFFPTPFELLTLFFCLEEPHISEYGPYLRILPQNFTTPSYLGEIIDANDIPLSNTLAVVPFIDMLNHDPHAQGLAMHEKYSSTYVLRASRFITEGSQIYVCYGPHDNARLWMEYGFTLENNPNGRVIITHELLMALARKVGIEFNDRHETVIRSAGLPCNLYLSDEGPSWGLRSNLRILMMTADEIQRWRGIIYAEKTYLEDSSQSEQNRILFLMMKELEANVISKMSKVSPKLSWMWEEQLGVINSVLSSLS